MKEKLIFVWVWLILGHDNLIVMFRPFTFNVIIDVIVFKSANVVVFCSACLHSTSVCCLDFCCLLFWDRLSLCCLGWPQTSGSSDPPAPASNRWDYRQAAVPAESFLFPVLEINTRASCGRQVFYHQVVAPALYFFFF
jgi:hypothetical protein